MISIKKKNNPVGAGLFDCKYKDDFYKIKVTPMVWVPSNGLVAL